MLANHHIIRKLDQEQLDAAYELALTVSLAADLGANLNEDKHVAAALRDFQKAHRNFCAL